VWSPRAETRAGRSGIRSAHHDSNMPREFAVALSVTVEMAG
jgi:hypothetical protein